jgi:hypothetical protein
MCCPNCGIAYNDFRTGFTFADIVAMLWRPEHDPSQWVHKRRNTILGKWHQIKLELWEHHLNNCKNVPLEDIGEIDDY